VIVGGDFNWRWRWRAYSAQPEDGPIDADYNALFEGKDIVRYNALDKLRISAGGELLDVAWILKKTHEHLSPVDKLFVKSGKRVTIKVLDSPYLNTGTPWHKLSDHNPMALYFELTFSA
jgi:hypothetical protein